MTINDKIKQILIDKNLTPSYFADEIGVQRSSISHILSGRNRPSFDIIQKIIRRFPELGYDWIMEEEPTNSQPNTRVNYSSKNTLDQGSGRTTTHHSATQPVQPMSRAQRSEIAPVQSVPDEFSFNATGAEQPAADNVVSKIDKKVERILIFYSDGTYKEYTPS